MNFKEEVNFAISIYEKALQQSKKENISFIELRDYMIENNLSYGICRLITVHKLFSLELYLFHKVYWFICPILCECESISDIIEITEFRINYLKNILK